MSPRVFALAASPQALPAPATLRPAIYSVPRPDGGFDYYEAPPGSSTPLNDDLPLPIIAHANPIGVSVLTLGRPLPPGSRLIGSGSRARGSCTAMPGVRADGPLTSGLSGSGAEDDPALGSIHAFGSLTVPNDEDVRIAGRSGLVAIGIATALAAAIVWKASR